MLDDWFPNFKKIKTLQNALKLRTSKQKWSCTFNRKLEAIISLRFSFGLKTL